VNFVPNSDTLYIDPQKLTYLLQTDPGKAKFFVGYVGLFPPYPANSPTRSAATRLATPTTA
jgi:hypothetical protein